MSTSAEPAALAEPADTARSGATEPSVSILMPVYNEEASVAMAIASVLRQTVPDVEILVIDGDSEDATVRVVEAVAREHPEVRLLRNPQRIIPAALNVGLAHARAAVVARVDAHLTLNDVYVETGLRTLAEHPDVAGVGGCRVGVATSATGRAVAAALSSPFGVGDSINHYATEPQETDHASMGVYRTDVLREIGGWDERLRVNEDVDLDHRILAAGHRIRYDPAMVMEWSVQETLRDFGRQYRRYGRGKAAMVRKNGPGAVRLRHLAAPALVADLALGGAALVTGHGRTAAALLAPYPLTVAAAVTVTKKSLRGAEGEAGGEAGDVGEVDARRLAGAFATMHLAWGVGFLEGLVLGRQPMSSSGRSWTRRAAHHSSR